MSISPSLSHHLQPQLFALLRHPLLRRHLLLHPVPPVQPLRLSLTLTHSVPMAPYPISQQLMFTFPDDYPASAPTLVLLGHSVPGVHVPEVLVAVGNWGHGTGIVELLQGVWEGLQGFWGAWWSYGKGGKPVPRSQTEGLVMTEAEGVQEVQGVLVRKYRQILQQMHSRLQSTSPDPSDQLCLHLLSLCTAGSPPPLPSLLQSQPFREQLWQQLRDGRLLHWILKSSIGLRLKKQLIAYQGTLMEQIKHYQSALSQTDSRHYSQ